MKFIYLFAALFITHVSLATVHVHMYTTPDTFRFAGANTPTHHVDVNNDGLNDLELSYILLTGFDTILRATQETTNGWEVEISNGGTVPYTCGAEMGMGSGWNDYGDQPLFY